MLRHRRWVLIVFSETNSSAAISDPRGLTGTYRGTRGSLSDSDSGSPSFGRAARACPDSVFRISEISAG